MDECCAPIETKNQKFRKALWVALILNFAMFFYEFGASFVANSQSLKADAIDFLGDSANYAISLFVLNLSMATRSKATIAKGLTMAAFGIWVVFETIQSVIQGAVPHFNVMGSTGGIAMLVNLSVAIILYQFRDGDSNMQSVWLCTRNDVLGNIAVIFAAIGVYFLHSNWPDLIVAAFMSYLSITSSIRILNLARLELGLVYSKNE